MTSTATAHAGERMDQICKRALGTTTGGVVEKALALNPALAEIGPFIAEGTVVILPDAPIATPATVENVTFWD